MPTRSRMNSKYLSQPGAPLVPRTVTHKNTLIWQWLQFARTTDDDCGLAIRTMRKRLDMTDKWANKTQLRRYMEKCRIDDRVADRALQHLWNMYAEYRDAALHNTSTIPLTKTRNPWGEGRAPKRPSQTLDEMTAEGPEDLLARPSDKKWLSR